MICPNCKTELIEVNGRYICSDCGREIPENEVMASDWSKGGAVRAGLYGAGTDEEATVDSKPVADFDTSLTESESEETPVSETPVSENPVVPEEPVVKTEDEPTVEEILQSQTPPEPTPSETIPETGFYTADSPSSENEKSVTDSSQQTSNDNEVAIPVIPAQELESSPEPQPVVEPAPIEPPVQEIPVTVSTPEPITEAVPEHTEVVKDMFENTEMATAPITQDPGIYTDPLYESAQGAEQSPQNLSPTNVPMPADKKTNLIVLIVGIVLVLLLIIGGVWGYLAV